VNLNDDIDVLLLYDGNPDSVYYATAFIYNSDVQNVAVFEYKNFDFKIWNYFSDFENSNLLTLRTSVYNPAFLMPS
jgi:hypothetical protein